MSSAVAHCRPLSPTVAHCRPLSPTVAHCRPLSPTNNYLYFWNFGKIFCNLGNCSHIFICQGWQMLGNVGQHWKTSPTIARCRPLSPTVVHYRPTNNYLYFWNFGKIFCNLRNCSHIFICQGWQMLGNVGQRWRTSPLSPNVVHYRPLSSTIAR